MERNHNQNLHSKSGKWKFNTQHGISEFKFETFEEFIDYITEIELEHPAYIYRGQQCDNWEIVSSLKRYIDKYEYLQRVPNLLEQQLENFKYSIRDRSDLKNSSIKSLKDDEVWSLGQHEGLATPLIDWTYSPFVAAFFAFADSDLKHDQTEYRIIYSLHKKTIEDKLKESEKKDFEDDFIMEFVTPLEFYHSRLINQRALHVKIPFHIDVENWVKEIFLAEPSKNGSVLSKFKIKNSEREKALKILSRMNISYLNLFPDVNGSSRFCNMSLEIKNYSYNI